MSDLSALLAAVEAGQREVKKATRRLREEESQIARASRFLEQAEAAIDPERKRERPADGASPGRRAARSRSKVKRPESTRAAASKREDAMVRFADEATGPVSAGQIRRGLGFTDASVKRGLRKLSLEGRLKRTGAGPKTRYEGVGGGAATETLQGRILSVLHDRASATLDELAQATRAPTEEIKQVCWSLIREDEAHMEKRDGRTVYVVRRLT